jgi:hypothetical protein
MRAHHASQECGYVIPGQGLALRIGAIFFGRPLGPRAIIFRRRGSFLLFHLIVWEAVLSDNK